MSTDLSRKRSAQPNPASEVSHLLTRLDRLSDWWVRTDLFEQAHLLLEEIQELLDVQACFLYLSDPSTPFFTFAARSDQSTAEGPVQLPAGTEEFWAVVREHWQQRRFEEVDAACRQLFLLTLGSQTTSTVFAPLFPLRATMPAGLLSLYPAHPWRREDGLLLRQISLPLAIRLCEQRTHEQLEQRQLLSAFVRLLTTAPLDPAREEVVRRQARLLGVDLTQPHLVVLVRLVPAQRGSIGIVQVVGQLQATLNTAFPGTLLLLQDSAEILCLLPLTGTSEQAMLQLKQLVRDLHPTMHLLLGVSNPARSLPDYARSAAEAHDALAYAQHFHEGGVFHIQEVGPLRFLKLEDARSSRATDRYSQAIEKLAEYDRQYHADLLYTLEKFLLAGGRYSQAARMMESEPGKAIAVGTVRQRVERMCELTGMDLLDSTLWLHLQLAIQVHHIQGA